MMRPIEIDRIKRPEFIDPGPAPMLQWLKIADLVVDDSYQRDLKTGNWNAIKRIALEFSWSRFSPVFVAPVEGGKYAIIDGQHRTHAAAACGFAEVPCQIVQMSKAEQAASFAAVNGLVTKVTIWNIFKAALAAGEPWAVDSARACSDAGCTLMVRNGSTDAKKAGEIYAIGTIRDHVASGHGAAVTMVLDGLRRSEFGEQPEAYSNEILKPFFLAMVDRPWLLGGGIDLAPFCDSFDIWAALDRAAEFMKSRRRQGAVGISRYDIAAAEIGDALDKAFPQRMALPRPNQATAA